MWNTTNTFAYYVVLACRVSIRFPYHLCTLRFPYVSFSLSSHFRLLIKLVKKICWIGRRGSFLPKDACKSDRSRQEFSNESFLVELYLPAKIGFDTAVNEPFTSHKFSSLHGFNFYRAFVSLTCFSISSLSPQPRVPLVSSATKQHVWRGEQLETSMWARGKCCFPSVPSMPEFVRGLGERL